MSNLPHRGARRPDEFTPMQLLFMERYMVHRSARRAAVEAGYADDRNAGWRQLQNEKIVAEITRRKEAQRRRNELLEDEVLAELAKIAFVDITDVVHFTAGSLDVKGINEIPEDVRPAIKKVTFTPGLYGDKVSIELHDKLKAQELLGKYLSMWSDTVKVEGGDKPLQHEHRVAPSMLEDRIKALKGGAAPAAAEDYDDL